MKIFLAFLYSLLAPCATAQRFTDANGQNVTYKGCYSDSLYNRTLSQQAPAGTPPGSAMTVTACALSCSNANYPLSGVEYGGECYCSPSQTVPSWATTAVNCNMPCAGNTSQICGGSNAVAVYLSIPLSTIPSVNVAYQSISYTGSYSSMSLASPLTWLVTSNTTNSIHFCAGLAYTVGAPAFAVISTQCYLAPSLQSFGAASSPGALCPGNSLQYCGTSSVNYVTYVTGLLGQKVPNLYTSSITISVNGGTTYSPMNCYIDSVAARVLTGAWFSSPSMTLQVCGNHCSNLGTLYMGLESGNTCFCGNTMTSSVLAGTFAGTLFSNGSPASMSTACTSTCAGDNTNLTSCGGAYAVQIFVASAFTGFVANYTDSKGQIVSFLACTADNSTNSPTYRTFSFQASLSASLMTPQYCSSACSANGYQYSGVQYSQECWCSSTAPNAGRVIPQHMCTGINAMACKGNSALSCGGANLMIVYQASLPTSAATVGSYTSAQLGSVVSLGCYPDTSGARQLRNFFFNNAANNTVEACVLQCGGIGFDYAAVSAGSLCFCGSSAPTQSGSPVCNSVCSGSNAEICGGGSAANVYYVSGLASVPDVASGLTATGAISTVDPMVAGNTFATTYSTSATYIACAQDSISNRVMSTKASTVTIDQMTPQACVDACTLLGMPYSGVEWGQECWCNAIRPTFNTASNSDCQMPCTGNAGFACGSGNRISLYYNGGVSTISFLNSVNSYSLQGCFVDSVNARTLRNRMSLVYGSMTVALCTSSCASQGFVYAGVEYGGECWCDYAIQQSRTALASSAPCGMPCTAQASAYCGGGNAINIYYNSALTRSTLQTYTTTGAVPGKVWNYKACWGEPAGARGLPNPLNNAAQYTVGSCLELGSAAGYNACGLEYGGECWCNTISGNPGGGQIPESYCTTNGMVCRGNSLNYCGAGNIFSFYSTGSQSYTLM